MLPIDKIGSAEARGLDGLLFDLDDTLLDRGRLSEAAYAALFRLTEAGLALYVVTGRPAGWGSVLVRQWPISGAVTENGAILLYREGGVIRQLDSAAPAERQDRRARIARFVGQLRERFAELLPSDDNAARVSDFTLDIGEHQRVPTEIVDAAVEFALESGFRTLRSTVHLHVTLDGDDKASGAVRLVRAVCGTDPTIIRSRHAFIGDSDNDQACFSAFPTSIAVRNLTGRPTIVPRFVTRGPRGEGFVEAAATLASRRQSG